MSGYETAPGEYSTVLGLFRHGQTDWNIDLRLQGTTDTMLNAHGVSQVERAAAVLKSQRWDVLLTSPLIRAQQTTEILNQHLGLAEVVVEPLLLERSFGVGEGMTYEEWQQGFATLDEIPGAESAEQVEKRARKLLSRIASDFGGQRVLAVSHGALIRFVLSEASRGLIPPAGERLQNASLHRLYYDTPDWQVEAWSPAPVGDLANPEAV